MTSIFEDIIELNELTQEAIDDIKSKKTRTERRNAERYWRQREDEKAVNDMRSTNFHKSFKLAARLRKKTR